MPTNLQLYCDLSHEKIQNLYNKYLLELQGDPSLNTNFIPAEVDHVRIHPMLNFDLIHKLNFIDRPKNNKLLIKSNIKNNIKNNSAFIKRSNKYSIIPDYIKLKKSFNNENEIIALQNNDDLITNLKHTIKHNKDCTWKGLKMFHTAKKNLYIIRDILIWYRPHDNEILPVITKDYLIDTIVHYHKKNHDEYHTTEVVASCFKCQNHKPHIGPDKPKLKDLTVTADYPLDHCMADLTFLTKSHGYIGLLMIIDIASRRCFAAKIKNKTSNEVIIALKKIIHEQLLGFNIKLLRVDNDTEFTSNEFKYFCESIGTKLSFGNAFSFKSGGKIERLNGTIKQLIKYNITRDNPSKWVDHFDNAIYTYNTSPHSALGNKSPFEMFIKLSNNLNNPIPLNDNERKNLIESQPNFPYFKVGDLVLKKIDRIGRQSQDSMKPYYDGPYKIIEEAEHRKSFTLTTIHGITKRSHYDKLKKFKEPPEWLKRNVDFQKYLWTKFPTYYKESNTIENEQYYYKHD
ncbi:unnamed protein product, partial [Rotaria magnacalcarata]